VTINGELHFPIQDGEHLFVCVVKVFRHPAARLHLATKDEIQVNVERIGRHQRLALPETDAPVGVFRYDLAQVSMTDPLREGLWRSSHLGISGQGQQHSRQHQTRHPTQRPAWTDHFSYFHNSPTLTPAYQLVIEPSGRK
jgi:hypothetical protein